MSNIPLAIVTGGAGFIGSHLVDLLLAEGYRVHVIDNLLGGRLDNLDQHRTNPRLHFESKDVRLLSPDDNVFGGASYLFHLAGIGDIIPSIERPVDYMSTNVQGTVQALEVARRVGVKKLVYAASSSCYGLAAVPTDESASISVEYPYALSKYQGEQAVFHWGKVYKVPVNSICIFNAYGTRFRTTGAYGSVFGVFLAQKANGLPFTRVGDGNQRRDWVYVTDVARAFYAAAVTNISQERFNVGAGHPQSVNRLIELLQGEVVTLPVRPGEPECTWANIDKIQHLLGWRPTISLEEGVGRMLERLSDWKDSPVWDAAKIGKATENWFKYLN